MATLKETIQYPPGWSPRSAAARRRDDDGDRRTSYSSNGKKPALPSYGRNGKSPAGSLASKGASSNGGRKASGLRRGGLDGTLRSKESPGLALLAAGSIVWNLLGPLGGALVKVAQHPAADPVSSCIRLG